MTKTNYFHHHGSKSDWATMQKTAEVLARFGVAYEKKVVSAHRTPDLMFSMPKRPAVVASRSSSQVLVVPRICQEW